ncbi:protein of unknown function DUF1361 [Gloeothece citriformis PCC 7424]|uniref:DUF1361 domain-containing protein n=1 Tax=Gloeothece citriformis (strain PCC 7424) TaxID=65393 RepID=B7KDD0_GLOC7|nr:DUF1361 domain-containing protein [Gloeothece citriformis]ACK68950.1 protein of unknown function DUF1361 [Gloeothece citriformis PCC 7424]
MIDKLLKWLKHSLSALAHSRYLITWNLFLAFIPLVLSVWLFRWSKKASIFWWIVFLVFIAFLPNAPYVLTDVIHLIDLIRSGYSVWTITLVLIPQYTLFILAGFEAYVMSLINLGFFLHRQKLSQYILAVELIIHALSAIGIYLGRFERFNSWDFVTKPKILLSSIMDNLARKQPIIVILITFVVITGLYWLVKQVNLGVALRIKESKSGKS